MKPNYLVIGSAKCGTTSLCALLGSHPDVFMSDPKEVNFFAYDELYARGASWFEEHFREAENCRARGEGSPLYSLSTIYPNASRRIAEYDEAMKLIFLVRNPIHRIEAGWLEMRSWGDEKALADFNEALRSNRDWLLETSNYWREIELYRRFFRDDRILVLFLEDLAANWHRVLQRCFTFLEVDPNSRIDDSLRFLNRSADKRIRRPSVSALRSLPGIGTAYGLAKTLLPEAIRSPIRSYVLNTRVRKRPTWSNESRRYVVNQLRNDTERFLKFYGKPPDFWDLEAGLSGK